MKIGRQIIVSTIIYVAIFLLGLVCTKVLTNGLSVADFGTYSLILSTIGIAALFLGFGFDKYIFIKVAGQDKAKASWTFRRT